MTEGAAPPRRAAETNDTLPPRHGLGGGGGMGRGKGSGGGEGWRQSGTSRSETGFDSEQHGRRAGKGWRQELRGRGGDQRRSPRRRRHCPCDAALSRKKSPLLSLKKNESMMGERGTVVMGCRNIVKMVASRRLYQASRAGPARPPCEYSKPRPPSSRRGGRRRRRRRGPCR